MPGIIILKYIKQFGLIIIISLIGEILHSVIPLGIPASIYGILILFTLLELRIIKIEYIKETGVFLVQVMPIMFIPAAVGLMKTWEIVKGSWIAYIAITFITTFIVMIVSGIVTNCILRYRAGSERQEGSDE